jgi:flagellar FliJ protein
VRRFRFRLAQLLDLRERAEERRREELAAARDAVRATRGEIDATRLAQERAHRALEAVDAPGAASRRRGLVLYAEFLQARLAALEAELAARRRAEEQATAALLEAVRDRRVLVRLRDRRRVEHNRLESRAEQATLDDLAQRPARRRDESPGTSFRDGKNLHGGDL